MNKLLYLLLITCLPLVLNAQASKGDVLIGTSTQIVGSPISLLEGSPNAVGLAFVSSKAKADDEYEEDMDKYFSFNISPQVGYFLADGFVLGLTTNVAYLKFKDDDEAYVSYAIGPFTRYYFNFERFKPFIQGSASFGQVRYDSDYKLNTSDYGVGGGIAFFVNNKVSVDMFAGYNRIISKPPDTEHNYRELFNTFSFGFGLSIFL